MASRKDRLQRGREAKERVLSGNYSRPKTDTTSTRSSRKSRLLSQNELRTKEVDSINANLGSPFEQLENTKTFISSQLPKQETKAPTQPLTQPPSTSGSSRKMQLPSFKEQMDNATRFEKPRESQDEWLNRKAIEREQKRAEMPKGLAAVDEFLEPATKLIDRFQTLPGISAFQRGAGSALGVGDVVGRNAAPVTGSPWINKPAELIGNIAGLGAVPMGTGGNALSAPFRAGEAAAASRGGQMITRGNRIGNKALEGALAGAAEGASGMMISGQTDAKDIALGAGIGALGGGILDGAIGAISQRLARNNVPQETIQEILALPAPRERGNVNAAQTPDVVTPEFTFALPEPQTKAPTTARIERQANQYRDQFENLMRVAQKMQNEGLFTPGREDIELESVWSQMAGPEGVSLDELITRAYPSRPSKVSPDLVERARTNQASREVAGAPMPVKSRLDRMKQQGVIGEVAAPQTIPSRSRTDLTPQEQSVTSTMVDSTLETSAPRKSTTAIRTPSGSNTRGFVQTLEESNNANADLKSGLEVSSKRGYTPITNVKTLAKANARITKDIDQAEAKLLNKTKFKAEDVATGMRLIQELQDNGNVGRAVTIAEKLAKQLTEAGQTIQAASIWNRLSPEGALLAAQRKVNSVNENLLRGQTPVKLTDNQATKITEAAQVIQASGKSQERAQQVIDIMNRERSGSNITGDERKFVSDFIKDAKSFLRKTDETKAPVEATNPPELKNPVIRKRVISYLDSAEQAARERIRSRGNQLSSTPLDIWADYAIIGASKMVKGALKFSVWSDSMIRDFGESVRPQLRQIYEKSKETLKAESLRISQQKITSAEKIAENWLSKNEARLLPEDITLIQNISNRISNLSGAEQRIASQEIQQVINSFEKAGIGRKASALQYIMMLLNPLTQIRNIVGNELMYRLERLQRVISTPIDIVNSKVTGSKRTVSFKRGPSVFDDFFQPTQDFINHLGEGFSAGWRGVNPEGLQSKYELMGQAFTSKYNPLTYMEKSLGAVMQGFDYAAYKRATNGRLAEMAYLDALNRGIKGDDAIKSHMMTVMSNMDDQIHAIASDYGKFATLQNESGLATGLTTGRRIVNKLSTLGHSEHYGLGSVALPFAKTPANLLMRSIDYSPLGVLKAANQTYNILRDPLTDLTRADVIESVSRAAIGTSIGAFAYWLADKGALWGKSDKDPEVRKLMQASGQTDFQINGTAIRRMIEASFTGGDVDIAAKKQPGDTFWSYSWAAPTATPIAIGSSVWKGINEKEAGANIAASAALSAANTLLDSSVLSSLTEIFKQQPGSDNPFGSILMNLVKQVPSQFVPSLARQMNSLADPTVKETYAMKDDLLGQITNYAESSVPGLSQQLPQRVSTLGKPQEKLNTFVDIFLSPAARSKYKPTPEAQLVIDLIEETGDNKIAPRSVAKYIEGINLTTKEKERINLTPEDYVRLQTFVGQETEAMLKRVNEGWTTERKVEFIIDGLNAAGEKGRNMMKKEFGLKVTK